MRSAALISCLLLDLVSSIPLPAVGVVSSKTPPTWPQSPSGVIIEVEDTKTNVTVRLAVYVIAEEEEDEGSGTDGGGRVEESSSSESDDITSDISSEEANTPSEQPISLHLLPVVGKPISEDNDDHVTIMEDSSATTTGSNRDGASPRDEVVLVYSDQTNRRQAGEASGPERRRVTGSNVGQGRFDLSQRFMLGSVSLFPDKQETVSRNQEVIGSTPSPLAPTRSSWSSDESDEGLEPFSSSKFQPAPTLQPGTGDRFCIQHVVGSTNTPTASVQNSGTSSDQGLEPAHGTMQNETTSSQDGSSSQIQLDMSLNPTSSEESLVLAGQREVVGSRLTESSSSSEEALLGHAPSSPPVPPSKTPAHPEPEHVDPDPVLISGLNPNPSPGSNVYPTLMTSQDSAELPSITVAMDAKPSVSGSAVSIAASSEASVDLNSGGRVKDNELDKTDDATFGASTGAPSMDVSGDASREQSVEEDVSIEAANNPNIPVSVRLTVTSELSTNRPDSTLGATASTGASASVDGSGASIECSQNTANSCRPNQHASSERHTTPPPLRRRTAYRFGFLGPITHSYSNQPAAMVTVSRDSAAPPQTRTRKGWTARHHRRKVQQHDSRYGTNRRSDVTSQYDVKLQRHHQVISRQRSSKQTAGRDSGESSSEETDH